MQHKQKAKISAEHAQFLLNHSPAHQPFNKDGEIKINRTGKKKGLSKVARFMNSLNS
jgi:hypothetical protein